MHPGDLDKLNDEESAKLAKLFREYELEREAKNYSMSDFIRDNLVHMGFDVSTKSWSPFRENPEYRQKRWNARLLNE